MNTLTETAAAPGTARAVLIEVQLAAVETVARDTNIYTFRRPDGGRLPPYKAGAHIDIHLPNGLMRQFSLVVPSLDPDSYVVGIKLDAASRGGSRYIFDELRVGHTLKISAPRNNFPLAENAEHVVLFAGGIGITPIWCMAQELAAQNRPWKLYYSCRSRPDMAFRRWKNCRLTPCTCISTTKPPASFLILPASSTRRRRMRTFIVAVPIRC